MIDARIVKQSRVVSYQPRPCPHSETWSWANSDLLIEAGLLFLSINFSEISNLALLRPLGDFGRNCAKITAFWPFLQHSDKAEGEESIPPPHPNCIAVGYSYI
jgi:hypothetical protein